MSLSTEAKIKLIELSSLEAKEDFIETQRSLDANDKERLEFLNHVENSPFLNNFFMFAFMKGYELKAREERSK